MWEARSGISALERCREQRAGRELLEPGHCQARTKVEVRRHGTTQSSVQSSLPPRS